MAIMFHFSYGYTECFLNCLHIFCATVAAVVLVTGIASWWILPRFRTFQNYVLANTVLVGAIYLTLRLKPVQLLFEGCQFANAVYYEVRGHFVMSYCCWLLVMSMRMYAELVRVLYTEIPRKRLCSTIFAWGVPAVLTVIKIGVLFYIRMKHEGSFQEIYRGVFKVFVMSVSEFCVLILLLTNLAMYMWVLNALRKSSGGVRKGVQAATFAFVMSGAMMLVRCGSYLIFNIGRFENPIAFAVATTFQLIQITMVNVFFLLLKNNRNMLLEKLARRKTRDEEFGLQRFNP